MSLLSEGEALRDRMRKKMAEQKGHIKWQNDRLCDAERQLDEEKKRKDARVVTLTAEVELLTRQRNKARKASTIDREQCAIIKAACQRAGVWDVVLDEIRIARDVNNS